MDRRDFVNQFWIEINDDGNYLVENLYMESWSREDLNTFSIRNSVAIDKKVQEDNFLEVFVRYDKWIDEYIEMSSNVDSLKSMSKILFIEIDDSLVNDVLWHPTKKMGDSFIGYSAMIPIHHLESGMHKAQVNFTYTDEKGKEEEIFEFYTIPFWVDRNK